MWKKVSELTWLDALSIHMLATDGTSRTKGLETIRAVAVHEGQHMQICSDDETDFKPRGAFFTSAIPIPSTGGLGHCSYAPWLAYPLLAGIALNEADSRVIEYGIKLLSR